MGGPCVIFDFDGTILDTEAPVYRSWAELWDCHGLALDLAEWQAIIGTAAGFDPWAELEIRLGRPVDPALAGRRRARRDELQALETVRPGIESWLEACAGLGVPTGIASSSPPEWVFAHLDTLGLAARFGCVVCCDGEVPAKPDPTSYRLACAQLGADPRRSVAIEDSAHGVAAAVAAGLYTIAFPHPLTAGMDLSSADRVVDTLAAASVEEALARAAERT